MIIVTKRTDEKFFQLNKTKTGYENIEGGTLVSKDITKCEERINFYLQSQSVNMGTAKTPHYDCILNEMNLSLENITQITYDLCMGY